MQWIILCGESLCAVDHSVRWITPLEKEQDRMRVLIKGNPALFCQSGAARLERTSRAQRIGNVVFRIFYQHCDV